MPTRAAKVAFSLDANLLARVERLRRSTGESRSALISRALALVTVEDHRQARIRGYFNAYEKHPEKPAEVSRARRAAKRALAALPWDD